MEQTRSWIQCRRVCHVPKQPPNNQIQTCWLDLLRTMVFITVARVQHLILSYWTRAREREHCVRSCPSVWQQCTVLVSFDAAPTYLFSETNKQTLWQWRSQLLRYNKRKEIGIDHSFASETDWVVPYLCKRKMNRGQQTSSFLFWTFLYCSFGLSFVFAFIVCMYGDFREVNEGMDMVSNSILSYLSLTNTLG